MAFNNNAERLGYGAPDGCIAPGLLINVISEGVATRTLTNKESGALCIFDIAGATTYTLPSFSLGQYFEFATSITGTGTWKITTPAGVFLDGGIQIGSETAGGHDSFAADGTTIRSITIDADTKGRIKGGGLVRITNVSSTRWLVTGWLIGSGTVATPFSTTP